MFASLPDLENIAALVMAVTQQVEASRRRRQSACVPSFSAGEKKDQAKSGAVNCAEECHAIPSTPIFVARVCRCHCYFAAVN